MNMILLRVFELFIMLGLLSSSLANDDDFEDDEREVLCSDIICDDYECPETDDCDYGLAPDVCGCCYTCAKGPGDSCGGMYDLAGRCTKGYYCQPHPKYPQLPGICVNVF
ncbi:single insulin-like growth factor-binding domain protein-2 [Stegodyphus dumicola]|uniref:single insulin-like growth factor-binding domain protein-2 n=1 Tax=Stegodyphus dumicola TaxID=202533 RepID=UPI0015A82683|nr:single insulin-like growth factor-binding domain protein-2 [Stegodyphus dumicola]XP_035231768.1 single insulin-like growth factor-binding domain protein-2 [Stegodyphus dumicola]XP_035231774.1 single insulin-like growth factor-binding domain protein-2 [Stegodyphus dumicola]XP_035231781.1 single insulin-like growth factor-binding domain protein-2 [Stegodyphus dumicola]